MKETSYLQLYKQKSKQIILKNSYLDNEDDTLILRLLVIIVLPDAERVVTH